MIFSSLTFLLLFLPITLILYYIVPKKAKNFILLICSLIFYAWGEPLYVILMLYSIFLNYICGLLMGKFENARKHILVFGIVLNLFVPYYFNIDFI
jgi:alginate O-acetyltransferase complex protein AlgI